MKALATILLCIVIGSCYGQQNEQTFTVKKKAAIQKSEIQRLFDLNLDPGHDTICDGLFINLYPVAPYYDSIGVFNLKPKPNAGKYTVWATTTIGSGGQAKLKFYQLQKDNSYKLVYVRSWVIHCK